VPCLVAGAAMDKVIDFVLKYTVGIIFGIVAGIGMHRPKPGDYERR
jgi:hypothetical protein